MSRAALILLLALTLGSAASFPALPSALGGEPSSSMPIRYNRDVRPILANHCFACHGVDEKARQAGLRLDRRESAIRPLESGAVALAPGDIEASELAARIDSDDPTAIMPPPRSHKRLSDSDKATLKRWIAEGARYEEHWAFVAPQRPDLPEVRDRSWPRGAIDRFILARLEQNGLRPSPEADPSTLVRRVSLDLTGLPPTPETVEAFRRDPSPLAYEALVDRLLASSDYAERMTMLWLDLARYADTNGYNNDEERTMWAWREWVIDAFAADMPFDRFLTEQLAGDLLPNPAPDQILATGFNRNHVITTEGGIIPEEYRVEYVADRVHTVSTVFLGLSMQCARCHDHKYDPISQREYYQVFAFFNNVPEKTVGYNSGAPAEPYAKIPTRRLRERISRLQAERDPIAKRWAERVASEQHIPTRRRSLRDRDDIADPDGSRLRGEFDHLSDAIAALEKATPATMIMSEMPTPRPAFVLKRGQYDQPGEAVSSGVPASLPPWLADAPRNRLGLARWLTARDHPLTARVAVNRWWQMLFGAGIVETSEDFGLQGAWPSHPELLDWLAVEFVESGWDVKAILKRIVMSSTYRQSSTVTPALAERDPKNQLLARGPRYRLSAETLRDNALAISGLLTKSVGGPSVMPYQPSGLWEDVSVERRMIYKPSRGPDLYRRGLYTFWKRTCPPPSMSSFDAPDREVCVIRRGRTNTPLQALTLLNDPTFVESARKLAERMIRDGGASDESRLDRGFLLAVARPAHEAERQALTPILRDSRRRFAAHPESARRLTEVGDSPRDPVIDVAELAAWTLVANVILNLDETMTKE